MSQYIQAGIANDAFQPGFFSGLLKATEQERVAVDPTNSENCTEAQAQFASGPQTGQGQAGLLGQQSSQSTCPCCGYCPACGRAGNPSYPSYPQWPYTYPSPYTVICGTVSSGPNMQTSANR